jgi:hypothetical protein
MPQTHLVTVGYWRADLRRLCSSWRVVDQIRNPLDYANEELGNLVATCTLRHPLGTIWRADFARNQL